MTRFQTSTLRPGLLVSLKTSLRGNVNYIREDLEHERTGTVDTAAWKTERTIADVQEFEAAKQARSKARNAIGRVCAVSAFGLLCPDDRIDDLEAGIAKAREIVNRFNESADLTVIGVSVIAGRIAQDDVEAARAINGEVRDLLEDMKEGVKALDVKTIRDAANKARALGSMLVPEAQARMQVAIDAARSAARVIVRAGDQAAQEVDRSVLRTINESRMAFLDLEDGEVVQAAAEVGRAIDFETAPVQAAAPATSNRIEME